MKYWRDWPIKIINRDNFPKNLLSIPSCPEKLFYRGVWNEDLFRKVIAIIGSREMSDYGRKAIKKLMPKIIKQETVVVSGFMYGIDSYAHKECLNLNGKTIAVLGHGLDYVYPKENDELYSQILNSGGLVISEYEKDKTGSKWTYPERNRIVAGLATIGILVVEAKIKSGTMITVKLGIKMDKKIMAVPGNINSETSQGTNWLIKSGVAKMINNSENIFEDRIEGPTQEELFRDFRSLSQVEREIIAILENETVSMIEVCQKLNKEINQVNKILTEMIFKNLIVRNGNNFYLA